MRIAHATDIHWFEPPNLGRLTPKRMLGSINLYLRGRRHHFDRQVQSDLVSTIHELEPDAVLITGDLTAQALPEEFTAARQALDPILASMPTFIIPGNHDVYTVGSSRDHRIRELFSRWMGLGHDGIGRFKLPGLTVVGLDPCRPHVLASGHVPPGQLAALPQALADAPEGDFVVLALHYPVLDRRGNIYDGFDHGLRNATRLVEVLASSPRKPDLIIHGHKHHGFQVDLPLGDARVPIHNPGASGYAWLQNQDRSACFNLYEVEAGELVGVERYRYGAEGFQPEEGGAYASGR